MSICDFSIILAEAAVTIILAEVFVRPGAGYLWSNDFARNRIGHLNILGGFHIVLGIIDMVAPLLIRDSVGFLVYGGMTFLALSYATVKKTVFKLNC